MANGKGTQYSGVVGEETLRKKRKLDEPLSVEKLVAPVKKKLLLPTKHPDRNICASMARDLAPHSRSRMGLGMAKQRRMQSAKPKNGLPKLKEALPLYSRSVDHGMAVCFVACFQVQRSCSLRDSVAARRTFTTVLWISTT